MRPPGHPRSGRGPAGYLVRPESGKIEETRPLDSPGSRAVLAEAKKATVEKPLVVCMGGPLTVAAYAYPLGPLRSPTRWSWPGPGGRCTENMEDYNGWADPWAAYVAIQKLRIVQFPIDPKLYPRISRDWFRANLSAQRVRKTMLSLTLDAGNGEDGDGDGMPVVSAPRPDYVEEVRRVSFAGWKTGEDGHQIPTLKADPDGRTIQALRASRTVAAREYQRAFTNPAAGRRADDPNGF